MLATQMHKTQDGSGTKVALTEMLASLGTGTALKVHRVCTSEGDVLFASRAQIGNFWILLRLRMS